MGTIKWQPTTEEKYYEMLEVLPPAVMTAAGFMVGEPWSHNAAGYPLFEAFVELNGKFYVASQPMTVAEFKKLNMADVTETAQ